MDRRTLLGAMLAAPLVPLAPALVRPAAAQTDFDVPFVTTPQNVVDAMLELGGVGPDDTLIDLGSGDGRIVLTAAKRWGTKGVGYEIDPRLVSNAQRAARREGVDHLARFVVEDIFVADLSAATVITMYLLPDVNLRLLPRLRRLRPGTRLVSHDWDMGDWAPQRTIEVDAPEKRVGFRKTSRLMLWTV
ncbi:MAG: methyltransferase domain-containing protein [Burkholderiales bacterium]|nr:MAG: methyltransferase domain-containing protein [Burkholderiales bacterium]